MKKIFLFAITTVVAGLSYANSDAVYVIVDNNNAGEVAINYANGEEFDEAQTGDSVIFRKNLYSNMSKGFDAELSRILQSDCSERGGVIAGQACMTEARVLHTTEGTGLSETPYIFAKAKAYCRISKDQATRSEKITAFFTSPSNFNDCIRRFKIQ